MIVIPVGTGKTLNWEYTFESEARVLESNSSWTISRIQHRSVGRILTLINARNAYLLCETRPDEGSTPIDGVAGRGGGDRRASRNVLTVHPLMAWVPRSFSQAGLPPDEDGGNEPSGHGMSEPA